jgi:hypothetical protein
VLGPSGRGTVLAYGIHKHAMRRGDPSIEPQSLLDRLQEEGRKNVAQQAREGLFQITNVGGTETALQSGGAPNVTPVV